MSDPCIHGPGVLRCGHPDCVGYREFTDSRFPHTGPTFSARALRRSMLDWLAQRESASYVEVREFLAEGVDPARPADGLWVIEECLRLNNPRIDMAFRGSLEGSIWISRGFDECAGGHPGFGDRLCDRCGRSLDLTPCPHGVATSFCNACRIEEPYPIGV